MARTKQTSRVEDADTAAVARIRLATDAEIERVIGRLACMSAQARGRVFRAFPPGDAGARAGETGNETPEPGDDGTGEAPPPGNEPEGAGAGDAGGKEGDETPDFDDDVAEVETDVGSPSMRKLQLVAKALHREREESVFLNQESTSLRTSSRRARTKCTISSQTS